MIQPDDARDRYGFRDANDREDLLTMGMLASINAIKKKGTSAALEWMMPVIILSLCATMAIYSLRHGLRITMLVIPVFLLVIYLPQIKEKFMARKKACSISYDQTLGSHFLVAFGTCTDSRVETTGRTTRYSLTVQLQNGEELENVLTVAEFYKQFRNRQKIFVVMPDSPDARQLIGVLPSLYNQKNVQKSSGAEKAERMDARKMRHIGPEERELCAAWYEEQKKLLIVRQQKNLTFFFLLPAIALAVYSFIADRVFFMTFGLLLFASYLFVVVSDWRELDTTVKSLRADPDVFIEEAWVSAKPLLRNTQTRSKGKTQAIDFCNARGKLVHRSAKQLDWQPLNVGDPVWLVRIGEKEPLACRRPMDTGTAAPNEKA